MIRPFVILSICFALTQFTLAPRVLSQSPTASPTESPKSNGRPIWTTSKMAGTPDPPTPFRVARAFGGVKFNKPVVLTSIPGTDRMILAEQGGLVQSFSSTGALAEFVNLKAAREDLTAIYGIAFHPDFLKNRQIYICYVVRRNEGDGTRVSRFTVKPTDPPQLDTDSEQLLLTWKSGGHNGGCLKFGPDGYLYISTGDASPPTPPDPNRVGQDLTNLLSAVLRIDVDHTSGELAYAIPKDNPFVDTPGARPEIWAYGFRNPWKMSFDEAGNLWLGDVGWELWEMIYRIESGGNYGWSIMEGPQPVLQEQEPGPTPIQPPTVYHPHSEAASITGGFVYRGKRLPQLAGTYVYGDYQSGIVWGFRWVDGAVQQHRVLAKTSLQLAAFGEDADGELYLVDYQGEIFSLDANDEVDQSQDFPRKLSQTGLFESVAEHRVAHGVIPYDIRATGWADHTQSDRWLAVPQSTSITIDDKGNWQFPDGSVVMKTVTLPRVVSDASDTKTRDLQLETQILHRENGSWRPYSYLWDDDQQDATLAPALGQDLSLLVKDDQAPAGIRHQNYRVAGRKECFLCHNSWVEARTTIFGVQSASLLGLNHSQMRRDSPDSEEEQIEQYTVWGLISKSELKKEPPALVDPYDTTADLNARARSYLQVNCAHCHQYNAGGVATIILSHDATTNKMGLVDARPAQGTFGIVNAKLVAPGDPYSSILLYRVAKTGGGRMPRVGSQHVDDKAVGLFRDWIAQLPREGSSNKGSSNKGSSNKGSSNQGSGNNIADVTQLLDDLGGAGSEATFRERAKQSTSSTHGALALAAHIDRITSVQRRQQIAAAANEHGVVAVSDLFERYLPPAQRRQRLGTAVNYDEILAIKSSRERGRVVFFNNEAAACKNCHKIGDQGKDLGPALDEIGKKYKSRRILLEHVLEPSKFIEPVFVPYLVETADGLVLTGLLETKNDREVAIRDAKNQVHRVPAGDVELIVRQQKSIMPDLLLKDLTKQEVADLIAYLASLRKRP